MIITLPSSFGRDALRKRRPAPRRKDGEQVLADLMAQVEAAIAAGDTMTMERLLEDVFYADDAMDTSEQMQRLRELEDRLREALGSAPLDRPWE